MSSSLFPSFDVGTSGKSSGTLGKLAKSSKLVVEAVLDDGGVIFDLGCGFGVFKFCKTNEKTHSC